LDGESHTRWRAFGCLKREAHNRGDSNLPSKRIKSQTC
jgi:hypothetical protein